MRARWRRGSARGARSTPRRARRWRARTATTSPACACTTAPTAPPAWAVFADPAASTTAGAPAAFDKYKALSAPDKDKARTAAYSSGQLSSALAALGPVTVVDPKYADTVHELLRWIEETE